MRGWFGFFLLLLVIVPLRNGNTLFTGLLKVESCYRIFAQPHSRIFFISDPWPKPFQSCNRSPHRKYSQFSILFRIAILCFCNISVDRGKPSPIHKPVYRVFVNTLSQTQPEKHVALLDTERAADASKYSYMSAVRHLSPVAITGMHTSAPKRSECDSYAQQVHLPKVIQWAFCQDALCRMHVDMAQV